jgi:hypothetical protein
MIEAGFTYLSVGRPVNLRPRDAAVGHSLP